VATTQFNFDAARAATDYTLQPGDPATQMDLLPEFAGRMCYQSWNRPNPKTAENKGYLENILNQGHYSVLEHASVTFYVEGVSRSLLTELERHRFISFSVISQRYVRVGANDLTYHPTIEDFAHHQILGDEEELTVREEYENAWQESVAAYKRLANTLEQVGLPRKKALEAAREVLPNATEVKMVVTGNLRAWRDVIQKRYSEAADEQILEFAEQVLRHLRRLAPSSVQDIPEEPYA
jgi:thymidylate synthase (FAD)